MTPSTCTRIALASVLPYDELKGGARHCEVSLLCILIQALGIAPAVTECVRNCYSLPTLDELTLKGAAVSVV